MSRKKSQLRQFVVRVLFRWALAIYSVGLWLAARLPWSKIEAKGAGPQSVLLTGTFFSENWIMNHLRPLALSSGTSLVRVVCLFPVPEVEKVEWVAPPPWLCGIIGETPARLLIFICLAVRHRPDVLGGFHIVPNGLVVALVAKVLGTRSLYFCGGGPREVLGGGIMGNRALEGLRTEDPVSEERLIRAMQHIDHIICMGNRTVEFYQGRGVRTQFEVIPGGIDASRFGVGDKQKIFDLIFVGRLVQVKRVDLFLDAVGILSKKLPQLKAVIVGTGELESALKAQVTELAIEQNVLFAGHQVDVVSWLQQSKVFVLTSDSEGLSLAMMEALSCALPCVVSDVGELGEIIQDGHNGHLVRHRTGEAFAQILAGLLLDEGKSKYLANGALGIAGAFELKATIRKWDSLLLN
jgi:L-malate glycosyltransferase